LIEKLKKELETLKNPEKAAILKRFFKTGKDQYGEGDIFLGIQVPVLRKTVRKYFSMSVNDILKVLKSGIHEERMVALFLLVHKFEEGDEGIKQIIYKEYLKNTKYINNWDLVDLSAEKIVGEYLFNKSKEPLYDLAESEMLWERRIAILSTYNFIKKGYCDETIKISEMLLKDSHDLIHKAVGWMLREAGKRCCEEVLLSFLDKYCKFMPRTMLRYAIEKLSPDLKIKYLNGNF